jgi:hypothetical protein
MTGVLSDVVIPGYMDGMVVKGRVTHRGRAVLMAGLASLFSCAFAASAHADDTRVGVLSFSGPGAGKVRGALVAAIKEHATVVDAGDLRAAAEQLGSDLSEPAQRTDVSRMHGVDAFIEGKVERDRGEHVVTLTITNGADGETLDVASLGARKVPVLVRLVRRNGWSSVEPSLQRARRAEGAAEPTPEPAAAVEEERKPEPEAEAEEDEEEEDDDDEGDEAEPDDDGQRPTPLRLELGLAGFSRVLEYRENIDDLPGYEIALPPALRALLLWYPAAHFSDGVPAHLGLRVHGQYAFGISSAIEGGGGPDFSTSSFLLELGLSGRIPFDEFEVGLSFSYGMHDYALKAAEQSGFEIDPGVPSTGYRYLHAGLELRMQLGDFGLAVGGAALPLLSVGDVEDWFPRASGMGLEGSAEVGYSVGSSVDVFALLAARRYAVTFDPKVEDVTMGRRLAGGMVDRYLHVMAGVRFVPGRQP